MHIFDVIKNAIIGLQLKKYFIMPVASKTTVTRLGYY